MDISKLIDGGYNEINFNLNPYIGLDLNVTINPNQSAFKSYEAAFTRFKSRSKITKAGLDADVFMGRDPKSIMARNRAIVGTVLTSIGLEYQGKGISLDSPEGRAMAVTFFERYAQIVPFLLEVAKEPEELVEYYAAHDLPIPEDKVFDLLMLDEETEQETDLGNSNSGSAGMRTGESQQTKTEE